MTIRQLAEQSKAIRSSAVSRYVQREIERRRLRATYEWDRKSGRRDNPRACIARCLANAADARRGWTEYGADIMRCDHARYMAVAKQWRNALAS